MSVGRSGIPANLRIHSGLPTAFVTAYRRRVFTGARGELWFGAHCRATPEEMHSFAAGLQRALRNTGRSTPTSTTCSPHPSEFDL